MKPPIIIPRGMDEILGERVQSDKLEDHAFLSDQILVPAYARQAAWVRRLNLLILRETHP